MTDENVASSKSSCASCGVTESDEIKLKDCAACYLVRYCSVKCQKEHWCKHKQACRKRAAELHDEILFKQPECSHMGDCPICMLPLPFEQNRVMACCSKLICTGCMYTNQKREVEQRLAPKCPFCRHLMPKSSEEGDKNQRKRAEANDPFAVRQVGGQSLMKGDFKGACEFWSKAVELGDVEAHYHLALMYHNGQGVEMNKRKEIYHLEQAAIGGHYNARYNLGVTEWKNGRYERAAKHYIIAAKLGEGKSVGNLRKMYQEGLVSKEELTAALRAYQAAADAMKSPHRAEADAARQEDGYFSR